MEEMVGRCQCRFARLEGSAMKVDAGQGMILVDPELLNTLHANAITISGNGWDIGHIRFCGFRIALGPCWTWLSTGL
jgi:hypothetical protein